MNNGGELILSVFQDNGMYKFQRWQTELAWRVSDDDARNAVHGLHDGQRDSSGMSALWIHGVG